MASRKKKKRRRSDKKWTFRVSKNLTLTKNLVLQEVQRLSICWPILPPDGVELSKTKHLSHWHAELSRLVALSCRKRTPKTWIRKYKFPLYKAGKQVLKDTNKKWPIAHFIDNIKFAYRSKKEYHLGYPRPPGNSVVKFVIPEFGEELDENVQDVPSKQ